MAKVPPPPPLANNDPVLNRWLLELTSILNGDGQINATAVPGLEDVQAEIETLQGQVNLLSSEFAGLNSVIANHESRIQTLEARNQVFSGTAAPGAGVGVDGDWFYNRTGVVGARLYIKVGGAWLAQAI